MHLGLKQRFIHPAVKRLQESALALYCPFTGVFRTFDEATDAYASRKRVGYNHPEVASMYSGSLDIMKVSDYATMFWLAPLIREHVFIGDFGGNAARVYSALNRYLRFPPTLKWLICDVPEVVRYGKVVVADRGLSNVSFTASFDDFDGAEVLHSAGTLQYVQTNLADMLARLRSKPFHLIINRIPVHDTLEYITVQNIGPAVCPYRIFERTSFVRSLESLGYDLADSWTCPESTCRIPFHPNMSVPAYSGYCFRLTHG